MDRTFELDDIVMEGRIRPQRRRTRRLCRFLILFGEEIHDRDRTELVLIFFVLMALATALRGLSFIFLHVVEHALN